MIWEAIPAIVAVAGAAWTYGSAGDVRRANFRAWLLAHLQRAKPVTVKILAKAFIFGMGVLAGAIVWTSAREIFEFRTSLEPMTRRDVFQFLLSAFNLVCYAALCFTCVLFLIKPDRKKIPLVLAEGQDITVTLKGEPDIAAFTEAMKQGISVTVGVRNGELHIDAQNVKGFSFTKS
jgi:hypothetical protein|tara:strand:+ start:2455 stop:2985 length:531 start_codon:yes stop_codon:yes gene_type:complete